MKAFLMHRDQDFDLRQQLPPHEQALTQDLELNTLFNAMALGDKFLLETAKHAVLSGLNNDLNTILYRQSILKDCLKNHDIVRHMYGIAVESIEKGKKSVWWFSGRYPGGILRGSIEALQVFVSGLKKLRAIADEHSDKFESEGFTTLFRTLKKELSDEYFTVIQNHLINLEFNEGVLISAELGKGNKGINYALRKSPREKKGWFERIFTKKPSAYTFRLHPRDTRGATALSELKNRGINLVANALAQSTDHILGFFGMLRTELSFYIGCMNLHRQLVQKGEPTCFPLPATSGERRHSYQKLYDVGLSLTMKQRIVGNDGNANGKSIIVITGANQGGKTTFLRSIGSAQLMMQCGMFVPAESFSASICSGLFTHYKREEDTTMKSGKLDEELGRMSNIVDGITLNSMVLLNESFAATNEREGSEIARQIICALLEKGIKIFFVTHQ